MTETEQARILIIDDEESIRKSVAAVLEAKGYLVDTAESGQEAIEKSKTRAYNLALIDIRLPDMEGTDLLTAFKNTPDMVKIIVTGYPSLQNAIEALNRGADGYVVKPFAVEVLLELVNKHLKKQKEERKYSEQKVAEFIEARAKELES